MEIGITYSNTSGLYGITTGNGLITWTYTPGDFSNGTGQYIYVNLPPYTVPPSYATTFDVSSTQITGQVGIPPTVPCVTREADGSVLRSIKVLPVLRGA